jgi:hypothetical protein
LVEIAISKNSFALRPLRYIPASGKREQDEVIIYESRTFQQNPYDEVQVYLLRLIALGYCTGIEIQGPLSSNHVLDVLDKNGNILHTFSISRKGFHYLLRVLKFRVEPE